MKLPSGQSINSPISGKNERPSPTSPTKNDSVPPTSANSVSNRTVHKTVNAKTLDQLSGTWAKVKSSQPLSQEQINRLESRASSGQSPQTVSQPLAQLTAQISQEQKKLSDLTLFLVKLETQQGLLSLLSQTTYPKGNHVLISLDNKEHWQIQLPSQGFSLTNLTAQFSGSQAPLPPLNLSIHTDLNLALSHSSIKLSSVPNTTLITGNHIDGGTVQQALANTGHTLENKLAQQINQALSATNGGGIPTASKESLAMPPSLQTELNKTVIDAGKKHDAQGINFSGRFKQVEQQVSQWVNTLAAELKSKVPLENKPNLNPSNSPIQAGRANVTNPSLTHVLFNNKGAEPQTNQSPLLTQSAHTSNAHNPVYLKLASSQAIATNDNKSWLMQNQKTLISEFSKAMLQNNSFIPNWSNGSQIKSAGELNQLFNILLAPKQTSQVNGQSIWPNNLSVQSQLNQTLQLLMSYTPDAEKDSAQSQLLRQIYTISQSLMKIQHEQIHNRLGQQSESPPPIQMSIPYSHQNHIHWAQMELKESLSEQENSEKTTGWHLILRFEQNTDNAFAIETQLKQHQLSVVLWATEKYQLKRLNQDIPLLKSKLNQAGFQLDSITSKHGSPNTIHKAIRQSLVDVHT